MKRNSKNLRAGQYVKVKKGTMCPDLKDLCIEGWQGRVLELTEDEDSSILVCIEWDSITLKNMPGHFIDKSEEEGLDYTTMCLGEDEVELTESRDTKEDREEVIEDIHKDHSWSWLGEEGKRIHKILAGAAEETETDALKAWEKYLEKALTFPFNAKVLGYQDRGPLQYGDKVSVKKISLLDDDYGIIVELRRGRNKYDHHPLSDLEIIDRDSPNYEPIKDYCVWFANR